jgi:uncharacterized protein YueI
MMMTDELQKHLDNGLYGVPLLKPDEQRKYLGTFRERCYLSMTISQMTTQQNEDYLRKHLKEYPNSKILINGKIPETVQQTYIQLAMQANLPFTVVATADPYQNDRIGLLVVAKTAVNEQTIDIEKKVTVAPSQKQAAPKKETFWHKLFR